jgi:hypothetical protein
VVNACTCGGIDIGVGTMHEPGCPLGPPQIPVVVVPNTPEGARQLADVIAGEIFGAAPRGPNGEILHFVGDACRWICEMGHHHATPQEAAGCVRPIAGSGLPGALPLPADGQPVCRRCKTPLEPLERNSANLCGRCEAGG